MKAPVFGEIDWTGGYGQGRVTLPYFRGFGRDVPLVCQDPAEPPDPASSSPPSRTGCSSA